ncbi:septation protein SepH [Frankia sp. AgB32]|uniref:septation protein SepH n=1 Tax=Frankia sp. AgB32 TaxID=631119 RepID=UPI00200D8EE7|nr:septation protein SepH [Frankia sp. AgB32]MCK9897359.1 septation protein SepH [Frankia sp. AgB32]
MRELRAVALSEDGGYLVLADAAGRTDGEQFRVPVDDRLRAALRGVRRNEVRTESALTPREIQARLRAGETAAEVARAAGIPVERVERYEGPVLAERARVVQEARAALLPKDPGGVPGRPLGEVVDARLVVAQDNPAAAQWDAWRRVDGIWLVQLTSESRCARWTWDPVVRRVRPHDDAARALVAPEGAEQPAPSPAPPAALPPRTAGPALTLVSDQGVPAMPVRPAAALPGADSDPRAYPQPAAFAPAPAAHPGGDGQPQRPAATLRNPASRPDPRWQPTPAQQWDDSVQSEVPGAGRRPSVEATPAHGGPLAAETAATPAAGFTAAGLPGGAIEGGAGIGAAGIAAAGFRSPVGAPSAHSGADRVNVAYPPAPTGREYAALSRDAAYADLPGESYPPVDAEPAAAALAGPPASASAPAGRHDGPAVDDGRPVDDAAEFEDDADPVGIADVDGVGAAAPRRPDPQPPRRTAASRVSSLPRNTGRRVALEPGRGGTAPATTGRGGPAARPAPGAPAASAAPAAAVARSAGRNEENPRAAVAQASPSSVISATSTPGGAAGSAPTGASDGAGRTAGAPPGRPAGPPAAAKNPAPAAKSTPPSTSDAERATAPSAPAATTEVRPPAAVAETGRRRPSQATAEAGSGPSSTQKEQSTTDGNDDANAEQSDAGSTSRGRQNNGTRGGERPAGGRRGRKSVPAWDDIVFGARRT